MDRNKIEGKELPEPAPEITPEMVQATFNVLESEGLIHYMEGGAYLPTDEGWKLLRGSPPAREEITAYGHEEIVAGDEGCFGTTKSKGPKGKGWGGVVGVRANRGCKDLDNEFKEAARSASMMIITIEAGGLTEKVTAYGSPALELTDANGISVRKSDFIDGETVAILADKSASEFSKAMKEKLRNPKTEIKITLEIK